MHLMSGLMQSMSTICPEREHIMVVFVHYTISLSSLCKLIGMDWTYEMPVRYILSSMWVRLSIFSHYPSYNIWGRVFSVYPFPLWLLREYTLCLIIIIKSEVWSMNYYPLFRVRSWNNGMRCMSLYFMAISPNVTALCFHRKSVQCAWADSKSP